MTPHVPLFAAGTGKDAERLRIAVSALTGREVSINEDITATVAEALIAAATRIARLEKTAAAQTRPRA